MKFSSFIWSGHRRTKGREWWGGGLCLPRCKFSPSLQRTYNCPFPVEHQHQNSGGKVSIQKGLHDVYQKIIFSYRSFISIFWLGSRFDLLPLVRHWPHQSKSKLRIFDFFITKFCPLSVRQSWNFQFVSVHAGSRVKILISWSKFIIRNSISW